VVTQCLECRNKQKLHVRILLLLFLRVN
jgi:hypothetical protein